MSVTQRVRAMRPRTLLRSAALAAVLASGIGAATAAPASATGTIIYTQPGHSAALATCYSACGGTGRAIYPGNNTSASMFCYWDGSSSYTGNYASNRWFETYISGQPGLWWIHSSYLYYQTSVPPC